MDDFVTSTRQFFHKLGNTIACIGKRTFSKNVPYEEDWEIYGDEGEKYVQCELNKLLPNANIFCNILTINDDRVIGEIDTLVILDDKIFAIEVKHYRGDIYEENGELYQDKPNAECVTRLPRNPFKQIKSNVYKFKNINNGEDYWINEAVFFVGADSIDIVSYDNWFTNIDCLVEYMLNEGRPSKRTSIDYVVSKINCRDEIIGRGLWSKKRCDRIIRDVLTFENAEGQNVDIDLHNVKKIIVEKHRMSRDDLAIIMRDDSSIQVVATDTTISVKDYLGNIERYMFSKIDAVYLN